MDATARRREIEHRLGRKITRSERQCIGKRPHTEATARGEAACLRAEVSKRYRAYKCRRCPHWHVGRKKVRS